MKSMFYGIFSAVGLFVLSSVGSAQPWYNPYEVARAAHEYAEAAAHFQNVAYRISGYSHLAVAAQRASQEAQHFHYSVEAGASYQHVQNDYYRLRNSFSHLRQDYYRAHHTHHNGHVQHDWSRVQFAWEDLAWAMGDDHGHHGGGHPIDDSVDVDSIAN